MAMLTPGRLNLFGIALLASPWAAWLLLSAVAMALGATPPDLARPVGTTNGWYVDVAVPVGFVFTISGLLWGAAEKRSVFDGWRDLEDRGNVEPTGEVTGFPVAGDLPQYEVEVGGRTLRLTVAASADGWVGADHVTRVETPLRAVRRGSGFEIRSADDPTVGLDGPTRDAVDALLSSESGTLSVDDGLGLVRYEADRPVPASETLLEAVEAVAEVAEHVEREAGEGTTATAPTRTSVGSGATDSGRTGNAPADGSGGPTGGDGRAEGAAGERERLERDGTRE